MFYIVNVETGKEFCGKNYYSPMVYDTERGAKAACTRANKKASASDTPWSVMESNDWRTYKALKFPVKMVKKINLMSGLEYEEAEDTPYFCSPSSETYWSS